MTPPLPRTLRCCVCLTNLGAIVAGRVLFAAERAVVLLFPSEVPKP